MNLSPGTKLGPYEVLAPLGAGGMGEVWRARDTRLGRDVAIKVLAAHLSAHPEIRARFEREARTVSALAHPNICVVHDVGREGDVDFLVMELVDGETLAARLARGPLPATDALTIGIQVADALDRAHRAGIVHRDLKPGNIMLTRAGAKLMDFGLARSTGMAAASGSGSMTALTQSPTMATPLTTEGSLIGTFQYMSPEQLEGREADARSDLWALGCVLYEMVAGRRPFEGRSQASLIGSIMSTDPPSLEQAAPLTSPALARTIRACLAKDPEQRIQTAHDVKLQLQWAAEGGSQAGVPAPVAARRRSRERLAWTVAAAAGVLAIGAGAFAALGLRPAAPKVVRFDLRVPVRLASSSWPRVSPDGRMVAFRGRDSTGATGLWVRPLDAFDAHPLDGTVPSNRPFWSPDSRYLAYIVDGKLRKVPVGGGPPVTICDAGGGSDGDWGSRDLIVFDGASGDSIRYVPAAGGEVRAASFIDRKGGEAYHAWPHFLPDGRHFLYVAYPASGTEGTIRVAEVGKPGSREVAHTSGRVEYAQGFLLYPREGTLMAQPFDVRALKAMGDAVPVGERIAMGNAAGQFSASSEGVLAYQVADAADPSRLELHDRNGRLVAEAAPPGAYHDVALSHDGRFAAYGFSPGADGRQDIWVRDLVRGVSSRITFGQGNNIWPTWSPDGRRLAYASDRTGSGYRVYTRLASGEGGEDSLAYQSGGPEGPADWSQDGRTVISEWYEANSGRIRLLPADGKGAASTFLSGSFSFNSGHLSPDGRWLAYVSNESGRAEVYLTTFPVPAGRWQVSTNGGTWPCWTSGGREIVFRAADGMLTAMAVTIAAGTPQFGQAQPLWRPTLDTDGILRNRWTVSADGQRFLVNTALSQAAGQHFAVVSNWAAELKRR